VSARRSCPCNAGWREEQILAHLPQVKLLAYRFHKQCPQVDLEDLVSEGTIGLIQGIDRFDPAMGLKVKTLAEHRIHGAFLDYLRRLDPLPRAVRQFQKKRDALIDQFGALREAVSASQLAAALGLSQEKYTELCRAVIAAEVVSLDVPESNLRNRYFRCDPARSW
jgi:RNA polymerase sigma factor FliA